MKIAIAGFGMEGRAVYDYYHTEAEIQVFDDAAVEVPPGVVVHRGLTIPEDIDVVFKSPGIPTSKLVLKSSRTRVTTFMDVVLSLVGPRAIGVTGTKGKSTVASLIHHVLSESGADVVLLGNIGATDAATLKQDTHGRRYVLELSSYQCEHIVHSPHVAVLLNLFPEHLSHHGSMNAYREAKLNIARFQRSDDVFINASDLTTPFAGRLVTPDLSLRFETKLQGEHNQRNCAVAYAALIAAGVTEDVIRTHIKTFEPLPYRLEHIGTYRGIAFYDDSLATIPEATLASIRSLERVDTLILGGEDRGIPFAPFAQELARTPINTFITFPETGAKMVVGVQNRSIVPVTSMEAAVAAAYAHTPAGGTVLLSNASPSFNLFADYKDKSAQYRAAVRKLS